MLLKELSLWPVDTQDNILTDLEATIKLKKNDSLVNYLKVRILFRGKTDFLDIEFECVYTIL